MQDAQRRLMRDWDEIKQNPLPTVTAAPLENNLFVWHANVLGSEDFIDSLLFIFDERLIRTNLCLK
jgi:ubiquitin-protein ligase